MTGYGHADQRVARGAGNCARSDHGPQTKASPGLRGAREPVRAKARVHELRPGTKAGRQGRGELRETRPRPADETPPGARGTARAAHAHSQGRGGRTPGGLGEPGPGRAGPGEPNRSARPDASRDKRPTHRHHPHRQEHHQERPRVRARGPRHRTHPRAPRTPPHPPRAAARWTARPRSGAPRSSPRPPAGPTASGAARSSR